MNHIETYPDECHETVVQIEVMFSKKLITLRKEYIRQLNNTTNSEEHNKVFARFRAVSDELATLYSFKQAAYAKEYKSKLSLLEYIARNKNE